MNCKGEYLGSLKITQEMIDICLPSAEYRAKNNGGYIWRRGQPDVGKLKKDYLLGNLCELAVANILLTGGCKVIGPDLRVGGKGTHAGDLIVNDVERQVKSCPYNKSDTHMDFIFEETVYNKILHEEEYILFGCSTYTVLNLPMIRFLQTIVGKTIDVYGMRGAPRDWHWRKPDSPLLKGKKVLRVEKGRS